MSPERVPRTSIGKNSIVDVFCKTKDGRMQMCWTADFKDKDMPEFIHHYKVVHEKYTDKLIEGVHIVFVELPKFNPQSIAKRKMAVLWLRFLTETNKTTEQVPEEFLELSEISQVVKLVEESTYTREQLMGYDLFWDSVRGTCSRRRILLK